MTSQPGPGIPGYVATLKFEGLNPACLFTAPDLCSYLCSLGYFQAHQSREDAGLHTGGQRQSRSCAGQSASWRCRISISNGLGLWGLDSRPEGPPCPAVASTAFWDVLLSSSMVSSFKKGNLLTENNLSLIHRQRPPFLWVLLKGMGVTSSILPIFVPQREGLWGLTGHWVQGA